MVRFDLIQLILRRREGEADMTFSEIKIDEIVKWMDKYHKLKMNFCEQRVWNLFPTRNSFPNVFLIFLKTSFWWNENQLELKIEIREVPLWNPTKTTFNRRYGLFQSRGIFKWTYNLLWKPVHDIKHLIERFWLYIICVLKKY